MGNAVLENEFGSPQKQDIADSEIDDMAAALGLAGTGIKIHSDPDADVQSHHEKDPDAWCCQVSGGCPARYKSSGTVNANSVCCKDYSKGVSIHSGMPHCADPNHVTGASSEEIDEWLDEIQHKYEHSDGAYSVHVAGALVLALVVVAV